MGWSCTKLAGETMDRLTDQCVKDTGSQNNFRCDCRAFFWEIDRKEYDDGRITGEWYEHVPPNHCVGRGKFTISAEGAMIGGHPWMRRMCR